VLQCVAVCCRVMHRVAVRCSVLQRVVVSLLEMVAPSIVPASHPDASHVLQCVALHHSALQCVVACCSVL